MNTATSVGVSVSALQSIKVFGLWRQPVLVLSWTDVKNLNLTWRYLRTLGIDAQSLKNLQPDKNEWIQRGGIQLSDLHDMLVFPVNPLTDFGVDLAELWQMRCNTSILVSMGITFDQLIAKGITAQIMAAFALPLSDWIELGFGIQHAQGMRDDECKMVFNIEKTEFMNILKTCQPPCSSRNNMV